MPFSSGTYTLPNPALVTGEIVSATENNSTRNDMATAFNLTFLRNGTSTATANLPMGGYKLTGLGAATTSGDALSYGAAANVTTITISSDATISGGTANGVAYLNGSKVLTTGSVLAFDGSTLKTTITSSASQLNGYAAYNDTAKYTTIGQWGSAAGAFGLIGANSGYLYSNGANLALVAGDASGYMNFAVGGTTEQMRLTSTGLGIGTSSPSQKLHVVGNIYSTGSVQAGSGNMSMEFSSPNGYLWNYANGFVSFGTNSAEKMRLDSSGNLGLGVTPNTWYPGYTAFEFGGYGSLTSRAATNDTELSSNVYRNTSATYIYKRNGTAQTFDMANGAFYWQTAASGTAGDAITFTQAMTLDASGNLNVAGYSSNGSVGVSVGSNSSYQGRLYFDGSPEIFWIQNTSTYAASAIAFKTNGSERMRIDSSGNVGIGTSSPGYKLDVNGSVGFSYNNALYSKTSGGSVASFLGYRTVNSESNLTYLENPWHAIAFGTGTSGTSTERMRIDSSGNVGIGVSSPSTTLDINGSAQVRGANSFVCLNSDNSNYYLIQNTGSSGSTNSNLIFAQGNVGERMRIDSSGNVGIGATPSYKLHVEDSANQNTLYVKNTNASFTSNVIQLNTTRASGTAFQLINADANGVGQFRVRGDGTIYAQNTTVQSISDVRMKENIKDSTEGLNVISELRPVRFDFKEGFGNNRKNQLGFIAQEVEPVFPDAVDVWGESDDPNNPYKSVGPSSLIPVLVKAIQELKAELDATKAEVAALKGN